MPSRSAQAYRGERDDDGWVRPYDPHRDVGEWSVRPHAQRGQENYGFERDYDPHYDHYYNRPYYISGNNGESRSQRTTSRYSDSNRHVPIPKANRRSFIYWLLAILSVLAVLLLVALAIFVVIYVLDLQRNNSTTLTIAPTQRPGFTTQAPPAVKVNVAMKLNQLFLPAYNDPQSQQYMDLAASISASMANAFLTSDLRDSYIETNVNGFSSGSVDVSVTISFTQAIVILTPTAEPNSGTSVESLVGTKVEITITTAIDSNACCQGLDIDVNTVEVTQVVIETSPTSRPSVPPTAPPQQPTPTPDVPSVAPPLTAAPPTQMPEPVATTESAVEASTAKPGPDPVLTTAEIVMTTEKVIPPTTAPVIPATTEGAIAVTPTEMAPAQTTTPEAPASTTKTKETTPVVAMTTEESLVDTTAVGNPETSTPAVPSATATEETTPVVAMTTEESLVDTTAVGNPVTSTPVVPSATATEMIMTTASLETTTEEVTTAEPSVLNPPQCGLSSQPPPSPPGATPTAPGTWPWVGSFRYRTGHYCGATLLSHDWAVTSVTCLGTSGLFMSIVFGDVTSSYSQSVVHVEREIERVYPHPGFNPATYDNDIAFIKMAQPVVYSDGVGPVCFEAGSSSASTYGSCYIAGWSSLVGVQENLKTALASSIADGPCPESELPVDLTDKFICAEFANADGCIGDLATGLMCQNNMTGVWTLVGMIDSTSDDCRKVSFLKVSSYFDVASSIVNGAPEYQCDPIAVPQCTAALSYSSTYPTTQSAATDVMSAAESFGLSCHSLVSTVLCTALLPECRSNGAGLTLCRQTCEEVNGACTDLLNHLALSLECESYPMGLTSESGLCESGQDYSCGNRSISLPAVFDYVTLSSPNHPNPYPNSADCVWIVTAPQDSYMVIKFLSLDIETCCDTLSIGEGNDVEDRTSIHKQLYGNTLPMLMVIPSSVVWLRFQSDYETQKQGFQAEVQALENTGLASFCSDVSSFQCSDGMSCIPYRWRCDGFQDCVLNQDESCRVFVQQFFLGVDTEQQITSPGYTTTGYHNGASHTYLLSTVSGSKLLINWDGFYTEKGYDFLEVGDGLDPADKSTLFFRWDGNELPPTLLSNGNEMWILFTSDNVYNDRGFDLVVFDVDGSESFDCQNHQFDCGHSVCIPKSKQCDGATECVDGADEAGCVTLTLSGAMILLVPFTSELENLTSTEYVGLSQNFTNAMDSALDSGLGAQYIYVDTTIDSFKSSDDPTLRAANTPDTFVEFTIQLINLPPVNPISDTQQAVMAILTSEASDGSLGSIPVNASSVEIYDVPELATTESPEVTERPSVCAGDEFECDSGQCVPRASVCDQTADCSDGTDEVVMALCPIACGPSDVDLPTQGSVSLAVPTFLPGLAPATFSRCGYLVTAPEGYRIYLVMHKVKFYLVYQTLILTFGEGKVIQYDRSVEQPLDIISQSRLLQIAYYGYVWIGDYGIDFEFRATNDTDIDVCDNGVQVLPAEKICDQRHDCLDYSDEIGCQPQCGQSNYTLAPDVTVPLQLTDYPANYVNSMACLWLITGVANASIIFQTFSDLAAGDTLSFGRGHDPYDPLSTVAVVPGILSNGSYVLVSESQAWVLFVSDAGETGTGFSVSMQVLYDDDGDFFHCSNLVQVVPMDNRCDGLAECVGDPSDEIDCDAVDTCQVIPIANCSRLLPYSRTQLPGRFATNAASAMAQYQQATDHFCQPQSELAICSLLFPECPTAEPSSRRAVCRSVCEGAVEGCNFNDGICDSLPDTGGDLWCNYENDILETGICGTAPAGPNPVNRIVNGQDASLGEWPWMLAVLDEDFNHRCGATLISNRWAITAGHCVGVSAWVLAGVLDLSNLGSHYQLAKVSQATAHQLYDDNEQYDVSHDIAVLKLETPLEFNDYVRPACLNAAQNETEIYQNCYATGWGALQEGGSVFPDILQEVVLPLIPLENCTAFLQDLYLITKYMVCAGYEEGGKDSCQGDSGGPLVCKDSDNRWQLIGATSFGLGCARPGRPGVYSRVSQYLDFIQYHVNLDPPTPGKVIG
ncbi:uncharacterized protein LOC119737019 isoform X2 [Patiria miniata]|uniref:Uncharacterized protein n=1 Tax=Patiria miniata TaxID=46514 RepID=A0A914ASH1_PATMI|nr:uncharacterized protein LOC119737019 isoform X2 [Patiria miniata]